MFGKLSSVQKGVHLTGSGANLSRVLAPVSSQMCLELMREVSPLASIPLVP